MGQSGPWLSIKRKRDHVVLTTTFQLSHVSCSANIQDHSQNRSFNNHHILELVAGSSKPTAYLTHRKTDSQEQNSQDDSAKSPGTRPLGLRCPNRQPPATRGTYTHFKHGQSKLDASWMQTHTWFWWFSESKSVKYLTINFLYWLQWNGNSLHVLG